MALCICDLIVGKAGSEVEIQMVKAVKAKTLVTEKKKQALDNIEAVDLVISVNFADIVGYGIPVGVWDVRFKEANIFNEGHN